MLNSDPFGVSAGADIMNPLPGFVADLNVYGRLADAADRRGEPQRKARNGSKAKWIPAGFESRRGGKGYFGRRGTRTPELGGHTWVGTLENT